MKYQIVMDNKCRINIRLRIGMFVLPVKKNVFLTYENPVESKLREFSLNCFSERVYIAEALIMYASHVIIDGQQKEFIITEIKKGKVCYEGALSN